MGFDTITWMCTCTKIGRVEQICPVERENSIDHWPLTHFLVPTLRSSLGPLGYVVTLCKWWISCRWRAPESSRASQCWSFFLRVCISQLILLKQQLVWFDKYNSSQMVCFSSVFYQLRTMVYCEFQLMCFNSMALMEDNRGKETTQSSMLL